MWAWHNNHNEFWKIVCGLRDAFQNKKKKLLSIAHNNLKYLRKSEKDGQEKSYSPIETKCNIFEDVEAFVLIYGKKL